jgi:hypothetical protein
MFWEKQFSHTQFGSYVIGRPRKKWTDPVSMKKEEAENIVYPVGDGEIILIIMFIGYLILRFL